MVFHPTEARVIGILDWEMSTVGHPLSDLANLMHPFYTADVPGLGFQSRFSAGAKSPFRPGVTPGMPTPDVIMGWYAAVFAAGSSGGSGGGADGGWDPRREMNWAMAFSCFRSAAITQGIVARVAQRQATSDKAGEYAGASRVLGEFAWSLVEKEIAGSKTLSSSSSSSTPGVVVATAKL